MLEFSTDAFYRVSCSSFGPSFLSLLEANRYRDLQGESNRCSSVWTGRADLWIHRSTSALGTSDVRPLRITAICPSAIARYRTLLGMPHRLHACAADKRRGHPSHMTQALKQLRILRTVVASRLPDAVFPTGDRGALPPAN